MKTKMFSKTRSLLVGALMAASTLVALPETASAQQIRVTGPLAGAPAVRKLRLYRKLRLEVSPTISFSLLDQYNRHIFGGARINFGVTDWLAVGAWGGAGFALNTDLSNQIEEVHGRRRCDLAANRPELDCKLTAVNLRKGTGDNGFTSQTAKMQWLVAPQITAIPFRGKLGLFNDIFVDADLYGFAGLAVVGLAERPECIDCTEDDTFERESRVALAPTFGIGFTFYTNRWTAVGAEWRALPFKWNTGGFDIAGREDDKRTEFPDGQITKDDREFKFNQMLSISANFYFPRDHRVSE